MSAYTSHRLSRLQHSQVRDAANQKITAIRTKTFLYSLFAGGLMGALAGIFAVPVIMVISGLSGGDATRFDMLGTYLGSAVVIGIIAFLIAFLSGDPYEENAVMTAAEEEDQTLSEKEAYERDAPLREAERQRILEFKRQQEEEERQRQRAAKKATEERAARENEVRLEQQRQAQIAANFQRAHALLAQDFASYALTKGLQGEADGTAIAEGYAAERLFSLVNRHTETDFSVLQGSAKLTPALRLVVQYLTRRNTWVESSTKKSTAPENEKQMLIEAMWVLEQSAAQRVAKANKMAALLYGAYDQYAKLSSHPTPADFAQVNLPQLLEEHGPDLALAAEARDFIKLRGDLGLSAFLPPPPPLRFREELFTDAIRPHGPGWSVPSARRQAHPCAALSFG